MLAVIATGGKQYVVQPGDTLKIEKIPGEKGQDVVFDTVLLTADLDGSNVRTGSPAISGATVAATIVEQGRADKIRVVKFKRKVRYHKVHGHRQAYTKITIK